MSAGNTGRYTIPGFGGLLLHPGDVGYDDGRRVFNGMIDRHPALIARCTNAGDVAEAIKLARAEGLPVSVYGGGHGVTGSAVCNDGICIDLRGMKGISVDARMRTVRAEAGLNWGEFDAATQAHGLAMTGGRNPTTGISGLALGSGSGWIERKFGYTCDSLIRAEIVTADGRQLVASDDENPDLFWAIRGGGGNFGVVTAFHFRLHQLGPMIMAGLLLYPAAMAKDVVQFYRGFMTTAPDEVGGALAFMTAPPADFVPEPARGQPVVGIIVCYAGPMERAGAVLAPLRAFGPPAADLIQPMPYTALQALTAAGNPPGIQNYWTADFFSALPNEAVDVLVSHATKPVSPLTTIILVPGGGAPSRVPEDATAFGQRTAPWNIHYLSTWFDPADDATNIAYTKSLSGAMKPWTTGQVYLNYIGDEGQARVDAAFGPEKMTRLRALKTKWDPDNLFRHNQNIRPVAVAAE